MVLAWAVLLSQAQDWDWSVRRAAVSDFATGVLRKVLLIIVLSALRVELILLEGFEYWYENREDRLLAAERQFLLPH